MIEHPCNRSTCTNPEYEFQCPTCSHYTKCQLHPSVTGHICHSGAREYLNREVIKELERLAQEAHNRSFCYPSTEDYRNCAKREEPTYDKAIKLLKEGVK